MNRKIEDLGEEPHRAPDPVGPEEGRAGRAAEEQRDDDRRHRHHVHELGEEEQREADRAVLGVEAADQLLLGLDEVERRPVELGGAGDEEDHERHDAGDDEVPARDDPPKPVAGLASSRCRGSTASRPAARPPPPTGRAPPRRTPSAPRPAPSRAAGTSSPTTSRPASRRTPRSSEHGEDQQHADGRVGELEVGVVAEDLDRALLLVGEHRRRSGSPRTRGRRAPARGTGRG